MGTRLSLYYIFVIFLVYFMVGWVVTLWLLSPEEQRQVLAGEVDKGIGFFLKVHALQAPMVMMATLAFVRFLDKKPFHAIGVVWPPEVLPGRAARDLLFSLLGAGAVLGLWYVVAGFLVRFESDGVTTSGTVSPAGVLELTFLGLGFLISASIHEWMLRGYIYSTLREKLSWVHAGGISALLFAGLQLGNPAMPAAGLASAILLGFLLAVLRELSGSVWTCAVFHGAWNFFMGSILSLPVSGTLVPSLRQVQVHGPTALSGGEFGPEGSWLMVVLLLLGVVGLAAVLLRHEVAPDEET